MTTKKEDMSHFISRKDFFWSVKLGKQLRVVAQGFDIKATRVWYDHYGRRNEINETIHCPPGHVTLTEPRPYGQCLFWVITKEAFEESIRTGQLLKNSIPFNWYELKMKANGIFPSNTTIEEKDKVMEQLKDLAPKS